MDNDRDPMIDWLYESDNAKALSKIIQDDLLKQSVLLKRMYNREKYNQNRHKRKLRKMKNKIINYFMFLVLAVFGKLNIDNYYNP